MYCRCARRITGFAVGVHGGHELEQLEGVAERAVGQDAVDGRAGERPVDRSGEAVALRPSRYIGGVNIITIIIIILIIIGGAHRADDLRASDALCWCVRHGMAWHGMSTSKSCQYAKGPFWTQPVPLGWSVLPYLKRVVQ